MGDLIPIEYKVKGVVFELNGESANVPNGLKGRFCQSCCELVGEDIVNLVAALFLVIYS